MKHPLVFDLSLKKLRGKRKSDIAIPGPIKKIVP
jgi:hypothetical protein